MRRRSGADRSGSPLPRTQLQMSRSGSGMAPPPTIPRANLAPASSTPILSHQDRAMLTAGTDINGANNKRSKKGECPTCGVKTHRVNMFGKKTPLTEEGRVRNGQCLACHPIEGYMKRPTKSSPNQRINKTATETASDAANATAVNAAVTSQNTTGAANFRIDEPGLDRSRLPPEYQNLRGSLPAHKFDDPQDGYRQREMELKKQEEEQQQQIEQLRNLQIQQQQQQYEQQQKQQQQMMAQKKQQQTMTQQKQQPPPGVARGVLTSPSSNIAVPRILEVPSKPDRVVGSYDFDGDDISVVSGISMDLRLIQGARNWDGRQHPDYEASDEAEFRRHLEPIGEGVTSLDGGGNGDSGSGGVDLRRSIDQRPSRPNTPPASHMPPLLLGTNARNPSQSRLNASPQPPRPSTTGFGPGGSSGPGGRGGPAPRPGGGPGGLDPDGYPISSNSFGWDRNMDMLPPGGMDALLSGNRGGSAGPASTGGAGLRPDGRPPAGPPAGASAVPPKLDFETSCEIQFHPMSPDGTNLPTSPLFKMHNRDSHMHGLDRNILGTNFRNLDMSIPIHEMIPSSPTEFDQLRDSPYLRSVPNMSLKSSVDDPETMRKHQEQLRVLEQHAPQVLPDGKHGTDDDGPRDPRRIDSHISQDSGPPLRDRAARGRPDDDGIMPTMANGGMANSPLPPGRPVRAFDHGNSEKMSPPPPQVHHQTLKKNSLIDDDEEEEQEQSHVLNGFPSGGISPMMSMGLPGRNGGGNRRTGTSPGMPPPAPPLGGLASPRQPQMKPIAGNLNVSTIVQPVEPVDSFNRRTLGARTLDLHMSSSGSLPLQTYQHHGSPTQQGRETAPLQLKASTVSPAEPGSFVGNFRREEQKEPISGGDFSSDGNSFGHSIGGGFAGQNPPRHENREIPPLHQSPPRQSPPTVRRDLPPPAPEKVGSMFRKLSFARSNETSDVIDGRPSVDFYKEQTLDDIPIIIHCLKLPEANSLMRERAFQSLASIIWNYGFRAKQSIAELNGVEELVTSMWTDIGNAKVQDAAAQLLLAIAASTDASPGSDILSNEETTCDALLFAMETHAYVERIQLTGCTVLSCLAAATSNNPRVGDGTLSGAVNIVVSAMHRHRLSVSIQKAGLQALYHQCVLSNNSEGNKRNLLECEAHDERTSTSTTGIDVLATSLHLLQSQIVQVEWVLQLCWCISSSEVLAQLLSAKPRLLREILSVCRHYHFAPETSLLYEAAFGTIGNLALFPDSIQILQEPDVILMVLEGLRFYRNSDGITVEACSLLANIGALAADTIASRGGVEAMARTLRTFADDLNIVEEALRVLLALAVSSPRAKQLIAQTDAFNCAIDVKERYQDVVTIQELTLSLIASLCIDVNTQHAVNARNGIDHVMYALGPNNIERIQSAGCFAYRNFVYGMEDPRPILHQSGLQPLMSVMESQPHSSRIQKNACDALWHLAIKIPPEQLREMIDSRHAINCIVRAMQTHLESGDLLEVACGALWALIFVSSNCDDENSGSFDPNAATISSGDIIESGAVDAVACTLMLNPDRSKTLETACGALSTMSWQSSVAQAIINAQGIPMVVEAMRSYNSSKSTSVSLLEVGCIVLRNIVLHNAENALGEAEGCIATVVNAMRDNPDAIDLQREACSLLWLLAAQSDSCRSKILALDGITVLMRVLEQSGAISDIQEVALGAFNQLATDIS